MAPYTFRYFNAQGGLLRMAVMQCASDNDAILRACKSMNRPFSALEVFLDDARIFHGPRAPESDASDTLRVA